MSFILGIIVGYAACRFGGQTIEDWVRSKLSKD